MRKLILSKWVIILVLAIGLVVAVGLKPALAAPPPPAGGGNPTIWVNDTGDFPDVDGIAPCDTGTGALSGTGRLPCTLRAAIQVANNRAGADVIAFEICPSDGFTTYGDVVGSYRISPLQPLPAVTGGLTYFNAYTQGNHGGGFYDDPAAPPAVCDPGGVRRNAAPNTNSFSQPLNTVLAIELDGAACVSPAPQNDADATTPVPGGVVPSGSIIQWNGVAGACSGLTLTSDRNVVAGMNIRHWRNAGILIMPLTTGQPNKPSENTVWGDFIGTNLLGDLAMANRFGVQIIGRSDANYIGETYAIPSWSVGNPWVEELTNNERNLISGNDNPYFVYGYSCADGGMTNFRDDGAGVFMGVDPCIRENGPTGGTQAQIFRGGALDNHLRNSYIGTNYEGLSAVPNSSGVWLNYDAGREGTTPGNHIGGCVSFPFTTGALADCVPQTVDEEQDPNLISGNRRLTIDNGAQQTVGGHGVWLNGLTSSIAQINGGLDVSYNEIGGNFIGVDATGLAKLPNGGNGVYLLANIPNGPDYNEIGATTIWLPQAVAYRAPFAGQQPYRYGNIISGNGNATDADTSLGRWDNGVEIRGTGGEGTFFNFIGYGNAIGLNSQGTNLPNGVGNGENGVYIFNLATDNYVYNNSGASISVPYAPAVNDLTSTFGAISDNGDFPTAQGRSGVRIANEAFRNHVFRNCIGGDAVDGAAAGLDDCDGVTFGNHFAGVSVLGLANNNWVGLYQWTGVDANDNQGNWIHHNGTDGVQVKDDGTAGIAIRYNRIWLNGNPTDGNLGIDLYDDNDTANDAGDADSGPNLAQNYPVNRAIFAPWLISFDTLLAGCPGTGSCTVDIYVTLVSESDWSAPYNYLDPQTTNNGEGRYWLMSAIDAATNLDISAAVYAALGNPPSGNVCISLTTTQYDEGSNGQYNTSEFSPCIGADPTSITLISATARSMPASPVMIGLVGVALLSAAGLVWRFRRRKA